MALKPTGAVPKQSALRQSTAKDDIPEVSALQEGKVVNVVPRRPVYREQSTAAIPQTPARKPYFSSIVKETKKSSKAAIPVLSESTSKSDSVPIRPVPRDIPEKLNLISERVVPGEFVLICSVPSENTNTRTPETIPEECTPVSPTSGRTPLAPIGSEILRTPSYRRGVSPSIQDYRPITQRYGEEVPNVFSPNESEMLDGNSRREFTPQTLASRRAAIPEELYSDGSVSKGILQQFEQIGSVPSSSTQEFTPIGSQSRTSTPMPYSSMRPASRDSTGCSPLGPMSRHVVQGEFTPVDQRGVMSGEFAESEPRGGGTPDESTSIGSVPRTLTPRSSMRPVSGNSLSTDFSSFGPLSRETIPEEFIPTGPMPGAVILEDFGPTESSPRRAMGEEFCPTNSAQRGPILEDRSVRSAATPRTFPPVRPLSRQPYSSQFSPAGSTYIGTRPQDFATSGSFPPGAAPMEFSHMNSVPRGPTPHGPQTWPQCRRPIERAQEFAPIRTGPRPPTPQPFTRAINVSREAIPRNLTESVPDQFGPRGGFPEGYAPMWSNGRPIYSPSLPMPRQTFPEEFVQMMPVPGGMPGGYAPRAGMPDVFIPAGSVPSWGMRGFPPSVAGQIMPENLTPCELFPMQPTVQEFGPAGSDPRGAMPEAFPFVRTGPIEGTLRPMSRPSFPIEFQPVPEQFTSMGPVSVGSLTNEFKRMQPPSSGSVRSEFPSMTSGRRAPSSRDSYSRNSMSQQNTPEHFTPRDSVTGDVPQNFAHYRSTSTGGRYNQTYDPTRGMARGAPRESGGFRPYRSDSSGTTPDPWRSGEPRRFNNREKKKQYQDKRSEQSRQCFTPPRFRGNQRHSVPPYATPQPPLSRTPPLSIQLPVPVHHRHWSVPQGSGLLRPAPPGPAPIQQGPFTFPVGHPAGPPVYSSYLNHEEFVEYTRERVQNFFP